MIYSLYKNVYMNVNKSECVRERERTVCEWYVDSSHVVSENVPHALFSPAQMGEVYHTGKYNQCQTFRTIYGRYF